MQSIGIDLDDTLSNMMDVLVATYNEEFSQSLKITDITSWDFAKLLPAAHAQSVLNYFHRPGWFFKPEPREGTLEFVPLLAKHFELHIVTAYHPVACADKARWIKFFFPCIPERNIIFCNNKHLIGTDFLIDDGYHNLEKFKGVPIIFDRPWNRQIPTNTINRVNNWSDIYKYMVTCYKRINK